MPISRNLLPGEKAVCLRLAAARRFAGLSQEDLANSIGITRDQLANIETGRTELDFMTGWKACNRLGLRQLYLADGIEPMAPFIDCSVDDPDLPPPTGSFRAGCLSGPFAEILSLLDLAYSAKRPGILLTEHINTASSLVRTFFMRLPGELYPALLDLLYKTLRDFERINAADKFQKTAKSDLRELSDSDNSPDVKPELTLKSLLARLNRTTQEPGKKSALAAHLGVPLSNVSLWLSGKREPGGETTLKLLKWVEQQERSHK